MEMYVVFLVKFFKVLFDSMKVERKLFLGYKII